MQTIFTRYTICILLLISCSNNKKVVEIRKYHRQRLEMMEKMPEIYIAKIPDSMKKWIPIFREVWINDQKHRAIGLDISKDEMKDQFILDSINSKIVTSFLDNYKWPSNKRMGLIGQHAIDMTIQHSKLEVQEKYYPLLLNAFQEDSTLSETLALLEDRINVRKNKCQFYGTQVVNYENKNVPYPLHNIDSANIYRKSIGLKTTIEKYMTTFNSNFNVEEYKKIQERLKMKFKVSDSLGLHQSLIKF